MSKRQQDNWTKSGHQKEHKSNLEQIVEIAKKARDAGMSYGKYVQMMEGKNETLGRHHTD